MATTLQSLYTQSCRKKGILCLSYIVKIRYQQNMKLGSALAFNINCLNDSFAV